MLLASDFDNTLYVKNISELEKNIEAIKEFRKCGNLFVIITGRGIKSVKKVIDEYSIPYDYLLCENGATIFDSNDKLISATYMQMDEKNKILEIINKYNIDYVVDDGINYYYNFDSVLDTICVFLNKKSVNNPEEMLDIIKNNTNTYSYLSPNWINIMNKDVNKANTLDFLDNYLNNKYLIKTIGDGVNDIEMITKYSGGIMKNHEDVLNNLNNKKYNSLYEYIEELI